ncbi:transcriptional regulator [Mycolicibacterium rhodesiae NBB3]|uniref:Transcriptional regulator n=1 Tax=Mycolicibacterium rhodesiae (strain NBB3) TaxID=710685 RepID=G8RJ46_MYCRN|nr:transcriptional regulator [Mycolicibacterium rhodesiae NBB3]
MFRARSGLWHNLTVPQHTASRGPGRPPAAKAAETRERIIRAAREVFSELGYDAATFQAIAIRAGLTRPAINHYFASKRVLWSQVVEQTDALVVSAGRKRAQGETNLLSRLSAFFTAAIQTESEDRSAAAFLVTSVLESQRHPELAGDEHDSLRTSREFIAWAVNDAIENGELTTETNVGELVEMLVAMMWGMGFYAGFVGNHEELAAVVDKFELLMANKLWKLRD